MFKDCLTGFNLTIRDSYLTILVKAFMNNILAENTYFTNHKEWRKKQKIMANKTCKQVSNYSTLT